MIISATSSYLTNIDQAVAELMMSNDAENKFRFNMGAGFVILVGVLIIGFFVIGLLSKSIGQMFRNDRGLQFITLFSLVIAITLFGLLNILEGKELSALLGGLSGYILGRSNAGAGERREGDQTGGAGT